MISEKMLGFINEEKKVLSTKYGKGYSKREIKMARTIKLNEEVGELCSEVLASLGQQRQRKNLTKHNRASLEEEFADTIIVTLLLARDFNVDINKSIKNKINKLKKKTCTRIQRSGLDSRHHQRENYTSVDLKQLSLIIC